MKDVTKIIRNENGDFQVERTMDEVVTKDQFIVQRDNLLHQREILQDQLDSINVRLKLINEAMEKGYAKGDTTITGVKFTV